MKKIIITMTLVIATSFASAQTYLKSIPEKGVKVYCELFIRSVLTFSDDIYYAEVDFGQRSNDQINNKNTLMTENGKKMPFRSRIDALNYMSCFGWNYEFTYLRDSVNTMLLSKFVTSSQQVREGLRLKEEPKEK